MTRKQTTYNLPNSEHLGGDLYRLSPEGFAQAVRHCHATKRPPKLRLGPLRIRVQSVKVLSGLSGGDYLVSIQEYGQ